MKTNIWHSFCNSHCPVTTLDSHLICVYNRSNVYSAPSPLKAVWIRVWTLMWLITLIASYKTSFCSGNIFQLPNISLWVTKCLDSIQQQQSYLSMKPESHPDVTATLSTYTKWPIQFPLSVIIQRLEYSCSCGIDLQWKSMWHILMHAQNPKIYTIQKPALLPVINIGTLVNLGCQPRWLTNLL